ncbi:MAG: tail fiber domain-containing protein [Phycisphaerales bacterium JB041]
MKGYLTGLAIGLVLGFLARPVGAQGTSWTYQGHLDDGGAPANGTYDLTFSLWDQSAGGTMVGSPVSVPAVLVSDGLFAVAINFGADALVESDARRSRWLEIGVNGQTLAGRQRLRPVPYAVHARGISVNEDESFVGVGRANSITGSERFGVHSPVGIGSYGGMYVSTEGEGAKPFYGYAAGQTSDAWHYYDGQTQNWHLYNGGDRLTVTREGNVGIGTTLPLAKLSVRSDSTSPYSSAIVAQQVNTTTSQRALTALIDATGVGSAAIYAEARAQTGVAGGVMGVTRSEFGAGVWGESSNQSDKGIGVLGVTSAPRGFAVQGFATNTTDQNYGVYGDSSSPNGYDFYAAGAGMNYGSSSSRRWKSNVRVIEGPLDKIASLRGVYFDWDAEHGGSHDIGMIAEEVGEVVPEIVVFEPNGVDAHGMDYSKLTPLLVEAVKALRAEQAGEMENLRAEKRELKERVEALEAMVSMMLGKGVDR